MSGNGALGIESFYSWGIELKEENICRTFSEYWDGIFLLPILGYVPKNDEKKNSGGNGLLWMQRELA